MDGYQPFKPTGPTFAMSVGTAAAPSATLLGSGLSGDVTYRLYNNGTAGANDAAIAFGPTSAAASTGAAFPIVGGAPQSVVLIRGGETRGFTLNSPTFLFAAGIGLGSTTVFATPGFGIV
jgi:hypothetical protein